MTSFHYKKVKMNDFVSLHRERSCNEDDELDKMKMFAVEIVINFVDLMKSGKCAAYAYKFDFLTSFFPNQTARCKRIKLIFQDNIELTSSRVGSDFRLWDLNLEISDASFMTSDKNLSVASPTSFNILRSITAAPLF